MSTLPTKIVSGGQTGVDLAALDFAIEKGIPHGGFCPVGRVNESGTIDTKYELIERGYGYGVRTVANVEESNATLIIAPIGFQLEGGTEWTRKLALERGKPFMSVSLRRDPQTEASRVRIWRDLYNVPVLNIAGPRESKNPGIYELAKSFLHLVWRDLAP